MRWTGEREGTGGEEEEERRAEMGGASVSDKVRDERDAGRKRQRGGTRGKWRCGVVVGAGGRGRGRLCSLSCGRLRLPPASRPHPHPHPLGSSAAGGSGAFVCACAGAAAVLLAVAVPVRVRVRRVRPRFLPAVRAVSPWRSGWAQRRVTVDFWTSTENQILGHAICASVWWWAGHVNCAVSTLERKCYGVELGTEIT